MTVFHTHTHTHTLPASTEAYTYPVGKILCPTLSDIARFTTLFTASTKFASFKVFAVVMMRNQFFWDVTMCHSVFGSHRFETG